MECSRGRIVELLGIGRNVFVESSSNDRVVATLKASFRTPRAGAKERTPTRPTTGPAPSRRRLVALAPEALRREPGSARGGRSASAPCGSLTRSGAGSATPPARGLLRAGPARASSSGPGSGSGAGASSRRKGSAGPSRRARRRSSGRAREASPVRVLEWTGR